MTLLLAVAIALLAIVVWLTWIQRRAQVSTQGAQRPASPARVASPSLPEPRAPAQARTFDVRTDPVLGVICFDDGFWTTEEDLDLSGTKVEVQVIGSIDGPTTADQGIVTAALARPDLVARAQALVVAELTRRECDASASPFRLDVGPGDDGVLRGALWYDAPDLLVEIGVTSADHWQTLTLVVGDEVPAELPDRTMPLVGTIAWNGDSGWYNREPFDFDGGQSRLLLIADPDGPGDEHVAWVEAARDAGKQLPRDARAMAAASLGGGLTADDVRITIIIVGDDGNGRFIGGLTCRAAASADPCYVWSRDRFATLSLRRG